MQATVESPQLKAVTDELVSFRSKLATSRAESANSRWSTHSTAKAASKVKDDVGEALMVVSGEVTDATKWKVSITSLKLKNFLKQVSNHITMKSQAAIYLIRAEPECNDSYSLRNFVSF